LIIKGMHRSRRREFHNHPGVALGGPLTRRLRIPLKMATHFVEGAVPHFWCKDGGWSL
jgi:hypothetical protein